MALIKVASAAQRGLIKTSRLLPKTGQTAEAYVGDDGTYESGFGDTRFVDHGDGTVTDNAVGLMRVACPMEIIPGASVVASNRVQRIGAGVAWSGVWQNSTAYLVGDFIVDTVPVTDTGWVCIVAHTSAAAGTFEADRGGAATGKWVQTVWSISTGVAGEDGSLTNITKAAQAVVTLTSHGLFLGQLVTFYNIGGMVEINGVTGRVVAIADANTFTVDIDTSGEGYTAFSASGSDAVLKQTPATMTWEAAVDACEGLTYAGYSDWRMPNLFEMLALFDQSKWTAATAGLNRCIDHTFFPAVPSGNIWTATADPATAANREVVTFSAKLGVTTVAKTGTLTVFPVRSVGGA